MSPGITLLTRLHLVAGLIPAAEWLTHRMTSTYGGLLAYAETHPDFGAGSRPLTRAALVKDLRVEDPTRRVLLRVVRGTHGTTWTAHGIGEPPEEIPDADVRASAHLTDRRPLHADFLFPLRELFDHEGIVADDVGTDLKELDVRTTRTAYQYDGRDPQGFVFRMEDRTRAIRLETDAVRRLVAGETLSLDFGKGPATYTADWRRRDARLATEARRAAGVTEAADKAAWASLVEREVPMDHPHVEQLRGILARVLGETPPVGIGHRRLVWSLHHPADSRAATYLRDLLVQLENKGSRQFFTLVTGIRLPPTQRDSRPVLDAWITRGVGVTDPMAAPPGTDPVSPVADLRGSGSGEEPLRGELHPPEVVPASIPHRAQVLWERAFPTVAEDHVRIRRILDDPPRGRAKALAAIDQISRHAHREDTEWFPDLRRSLPGPEAGPVRAAVDHAAAEHVPLARGLQAWRSSVGAGDPTPPAGLLDQIRHHFDEEERDLYAPATAQGAMEPALWDVLLRIRKGATADLSALWTERALGLVGVTLEPVVVLVPLRGTYERKLAVLPRESEAPVRAWVNAVTSVAPPPEDRAPGWERTAPAWLPRVGPITPYRIYTTGPHPEVTRGPSGHGPGTTLVQAAVDGARSWYSLPAIRAWIPGRAAPIDMVPHATPDPTSDRGRPKAGSLTDFASYARVPVEILPPDPDHPGANRARIPPELVAAVSDALHLPTPEEERAAKGRKKREEAVARGQGTCGICFGSYARHPRGTIVQHGYQMGGGWGRGHEGMYKASSDCYGVGWQPWEVDHAAADAHLVRLCTWLVAAVADVRVWTDRAPGEVADTIPALRIPGRFGQPPAIRPYNWPRFTGEKPGDPETLPKDAVEVTLHRGTPEWSGYCDLKLRAAVGHRDSLRAEIRFYETAVAGWPAYPNRPDGPVESPVPPPVPTAELFPPAVERMADPTPVGGSWADAWDRFERGEHAQMVARQRATQHRPWSPTPLSGEPPPWQLSYDDLLAREGSSTVRRRPLLALFRDAARREFDGGESGWETVRGNYDEELAGRDRAQFPMGQLSKLHLDSLRAAQDRGETIPPAALLRYPEDALRRYGLLGGTSSTTAYARFPDPPSGDGVLWEPPDPELDTYGNEVETVWPTHRVGVSPDDLPYGTRTPDVDPSLRDLQDADDTGPRGVTAETILRDYAPGPGTYDVYVAYVEFGDLPSPVLAERETAEDDRRACLQEARDAYDTCWDAPPEGADLDPCDDALQAAEDACVADYPEDGGYDWSEIRTGGPYPAPKIYVDDHGTIAILDGNHRLTAWEESYRGTLCWVIQRVHPG